MPIEFTRKGRYEVWLNGQKISEHNQEREATETIINHSAVHGDGEYEIKGYLVMARAYGVVSNQDGGDTTPPTTPGSVSSVATSATTGTTSWTASTDNVGVAGYQIFVDGSPVGTTVDLSFNHSGLSPSTQYSVTVTAYDAAGNNSVAGGPALFTTDSNSAPVWSLGNQAYETGQSVNIDLDSVCTDADGDTITYSLVSGTLPSGLSLSGTRNETLSGTVDTVESAVFTLGASDGIAAVQNVALTFTITTPDTTAPDAPTGLSVVSTTSSSIGLDWSDNAESDLNHYDVYRSTVSASGPWGQRNGSPLSSSNYSDTGLNEQTQYWYYVTATDDSDNESDPSSVVTDTTVAADGGVHDITGLPLDGNGFHDLEAIINGDAAYATARFLYVDPTGGNDGTAQTYSRGDFTNMFQPESVNAYQTVAAADAQRRNGFPDVILLKRGETFDQAPDLKSGASATAYNIVAAYGSGARPQFPTGEVVGPGASSTRQYMYYGDCHFDGGNTDSEGPFYWVHGFTNVRFDYNIFENNYTTRYAKNAMQHGAFGSANNLATGNVWRRNIFYRMYGTGALNGFNGNQAIYFRHDHGVTVEQNLCIENGWDGINTSSQNTQSRHFYVDDCIEPLIRENVCIRPSSEQFQFRANSPQFQNQGTGINNLCIDGQLHCYLSGNDGDVQLQFLNNVIMGQRDGNSIGFAGQAIQIEYMSNGLIQGNLIANIPSGPFNNSIFVFQAPVSNLTFNNNYIHNSGDVFLDGGSGGYTGMSFTNNRVYEPDGICLRHDTAYVSATNNQFAGTASPCQHDGSTYTPSAWEALGEVSGSGNSVWSSPPASVSDIGDYLDAQGYNGGSGNSTSTYMALLLAQDRTSWDSALEASTINDYFRAEVGLVV